MIEIRLLLPGDDRKEFTSGSEPLDRYFRQFAGQNQFRHRIGANYVAVESGVIIGFATVSPAQIETVRLTAATAKRLPAYPLPALRLARLATHLKHRGKGVGEALLRYVFNLALRMAQDFGCAGVVVDAKPDAVKFYSRFGFRGLATEDGGTGGELMFLPLGSIHKDKFPAFSVPADSDSLTLEDVRRNEDEA